VITLSQLSNQSGAEQLKLVTIVGARPQFIKSNIVSKAIAEHTGVAASAHLTEIVVHTGQHYDHQMSQVFFDELGLNPPDYHLGVGSGSHGAQTGRMLERIEEVLLRESPELVLVYGDTNSTLAGALAAAKLNIPVAHVEAGLRSFNPVMAEEINRVLADHLSALLLAPTETAVKNLQHEGITGGVHQVGDVMYDAALTYRELARAKSRVLERFNLYPKNYALATVHRAENTDQPKRLRGIFDALQALAQDQPLVVPVHPRTQQAMNASPAFATGNLVLTEPVSYLDMLRLESESCLILTDSGGVQKEAFFFRVPCVTLRDETEWVETLDSGWNVVAGTDSQRIVDAARRAKPGRDDTWPFGTGDASRKSVNVIVDFLCET
jgi:UDP-N-acetylglucosamine 2-epimerase